MKTERNVDEESSKHVLQGAGTARGVQDLNLECREIQPKLSLSQSQTNKCNVMQATHIAHTDGSTHVYFYIEIALPLT